MHEFSIGRLLQSHKLLCVCAKQTAENDRRTYMARFCLEEFCGIETCPNAHLLMNAIGYMRGAHINGSIVKWRTHTTTLNDMCEREVLVVDVAIGGVKASVDR